MTNINDLIEDLRLNHEFCPKEVILEAADALEAQSKQIDNFCMDYRIKCDAETKVLYAQIEALQADANRYRWLRSSIANSFDDPDAPQVRISQDYDYALPENLDAQIEAVAAEMQKYKNKE
jgi:hypothetical protein